MEREGRGGGGIWAVAGSSGDAARLRGLSGQDVSRREIHPEGLVEGSWDRSDVEGYQAGWGARARGMGAVRGGGGRRGGGGGGGA